MLVLDEPTNDLDIETLELLEELVGDFDGTVLLVSHDRAFLDHVVTSTLAFEGDGRVAEYVGGWEDYLRQSASGDAQSSGRTAPETERSGAGDRRAREADTAARRKLSYKEQRELEALPARIEALEGEQQRLRAESEAADFYRATSDHIRGVLSRLEAVGPELEARSSDGWSWRNETSRGARCAGEVRRHRGSGIPR